VSFCTVSVLFLGSAFSPVVRASLVSLKADAPGCRELEALGVLVVSAGCLRHKTGNVTFAAHMIFTALKCCLRQNCQSYSALRCCRVLLPRPTARMQNVRAIRRSGVATCTYSAALIFKVSFCSNLGVARFCFKCVEFLFFFRNT
jgi:hypothetical protein